MVGAVGGAIGSDLATKSELKAEVQSIRSDMKSVESKLRAEIQTVRGEVQAVRSDLQSQMQALELRMTLRIGALLIAVAGLIIAAQRFLG